MQISTLEILKSIHRFLFTKIQVVNHDFLDTSRTCDAVILSSSSPLDHAVTIFTMISHMISAKYCVPAQPLFSLRFHGFRENCHG